MITIVLAVGARVWHIILICGITLLLLACQTRPPAVRPTPTLSPPTVVSTTIKTGYLAYIGADGNIYVTTPDHQTTIAVTDDATVSREGAGLSYQRIAWSPEGQLAYASVTRMQDNASSQLFVKKSLDAPPQMIGESDTHFVIYIYWSPVSCPDQPDCRQLAYLIEEEEDIALRLVTMAGEKVDNRIIGFGWPFYYTWAPDGRSMLWHTGGSVQDNAAAQLRHYHLEPATTERLPQKPASFLAPAWSPSGQVWVGATVEGTQAQLQLFPKRSFAKQPFTETEAETLAQVLEGGATFAWSPDGSRLAYAVRASNNHRFYRPIHIFDRASSQARQITADGFQVLAFFWDPAGQRLAYLVLLAMPDEEWLQWRVYDLDQEEDRGFKVFNPSLQMRFVMASFNQYAQSHRFWSPDGRYLVYASRNEISRRELVGLVDTWAEDGTDTVAIAEGTMGFWSW